MDHNVVGWFEIPVLDMDRAINFYESVFKMKFERNKMGVLDMAIFPNYPETKGANGALVYYPDFYKPSHEGPLIYFTAFSGDVSVELQRVKEAHGKVLVEKKQISEDVGYMGLFEDCEGNRIALHSRN